MIYNQLEPGDNWIDKRTGCTLPHESLIYDGDPAELESLSGECDTYNLADLVHK